MINLKLIGSANTIPSGFWLTILWIFAVGIKNGNDNHGSYVMISVGIWRLLAHFTLTFDTNE
tara:strand:- start:4296 stop:4481 length:186 start_codon:yes stop_codon:yes gene_type:complete